MSQAGGAFCCAMLSPTGRALLWCFPWGRSAVAQAQGMGTGGRQRPYLLAALLLCSLALSVGRVTHALHKARDVAWLCSWCVAPALLYVRLQPPMHHCSIGAGSWQARACSGVITCPTSRAFPAHLYLKALSHLSCKGCTSNVERKTQRPPWKPGLTYLLTMDCTYRM